MKRWFTAALVAVLLAVSAPAPARANSCTDCTAVYNMMEFLSLYQPNVWWAIQMEWYQWALETTGPEGMGWPTEEETCAFLSFALIDHGYGV